MIALTLKQLRYFEALATHGHFGKAAESCFISQPALSLQIKELETLMGGPLVERSAREVRLTARGEDLLEHTREILQRVEDLSLFAQRHSGAFSGRLRIGVIPTVAPYLLPKLIKALSTRFKDLVLEPKEAITQTLLEQILVSKLDIAIVALPVSEPALREFALFEEEFLLVRPESDAFLPVPDISDLPEIQLLLLEEGHCFREQALSFCNASSRTARTIMECSSLSTLVQMVSSGIGVTLIPEMAEAFETRSANVSVSRFAKPAPSRTIGMIWRKTNPLVDQLMEIGAIVKKEAQST